MLGPAPPRLSGPGPGRDAATASSGSVTAQPGRVRSEANCDTEPWGLSSRLQDAVELHSFHIRSSRVACRKLWNDSRRNSRAMPAGIPAGIPVACRTLWSCPQESRAVALIWGPEGPKSNIWGPKGQHLGPEGPTFGARRAHIWGPKGTQCRHQMAWFGARSGPPARCLAPGRGRGERAGSGPQRPAAVTGRRSAAARRPPPPGPGPRMPLPAPTAAARRSNARCDLISLQSPPAVI